jgi:hypothetical protein
VVLLSEGWLNNKIKILKTTGQGLHPAVGSFDRIFKCQRLAARRRKADLCRLLQCIKGSNRIDRFEGTLQRSDIVDMLIQQRDRGLLDPTHGSIEIFYGKPGINNVDNQHLGHPGHHRLLKKCRILR